MNIQSFHRELSSLLEQLPLTIHRGFLQQEVQGLNFILKSYQNGDIGAETQGKILLRFSYWMTTLAKIPGPNEQVENFIANANTFINKTLHEKEVLYYYLMGKPSSRVYKDKSAIAKLVVMSTGLSDEAVAKKSSESWKKLSENYTELYLNDIIDKMNAGEPKIDNFAADEIDEPEEALPGFVFRRFFLKSHNDGNLDVIQIMSADKKHQPFPAKDSVHVVWFLANLEVSQRSIAYLYDLQQRWSLKYEKPVYLTVMNYRCVYHSAGKLSNMQCLVDDGVTLVNHLAEQGAKPEDTILIGRSLGGAIAVGTADQCHNQWNGPEDKFPVAVVNLCSFHHVSHVFSGVRFFGFAIKEWELNIAKAFNRIPTDKKMFFCIKPDKNHLDQSKDDTIRHKASLYTGLKALLKDKRYEVNADTVTSGFDPAANDNKTQRNLVKLRGIITNEGDIEQQDLHMTPLYDLENRTGKNAQILLDEFIGRQLGIGPNISNNLHQI